jgi:hypothetical protein
MSWTFCDHQSQSGNESLISCKLNGFAAEVYYEEPAVILDSKLCLIDQ